MKRSRSAQLRVRRVVLQVARPDDVRQRRQRHGGAGVAGVGRLHRVHGQRADGVDAEPVERLGFGGHLSSWFVRELPGCVDVESGCASDGFAARRRRPPAPGLLPHKLPGGEENSIRLRHALTCARRGPLPRPLPARSSRRGENSIALRRACPPYLPPPRSLWGRAGGGPPTISRPAVRTRSGHPAPRVSPLSRLRGEGATACRNERPSGRPGSPRCAPAPAARPRAASPRGAATGASGGRARRR